LKENLFFILWFVSYYSFVPLNSAGAPQFVCLSFKLHMWNLLSEVLFEGILIWVQLFKENFISRKKEYEINGILMQKVGTAVICVFINENFKKLGNSYLKLMSFKICVHNFFPSCIP
jgi:hypothetical protein